MKNHNILLCARASGISSDLLPLQPAQESTDKLYTEKGLITSTLGQGPWGDLALKQNTVDHGLLDSLTLEL